MISIVIPSYNTCKILESCILSIIKYTQNIEYEIIVIDDCSTDNSYEYIKNRFPNIIIKKNRINLGFVRTVNKGLKISKGEYILLLNLYYLSKNIKWY